LRQASIGNTTREIKSTPTEILDRMVTKLLNSPAGTEWVSTHLVTADVSWPREIRDRHGKFRRQDLLRPLAIDRSTDDAWRTAAQAAAAIVRGDADLN